jgi:hypothetical protein
MAKVRPAPKMKGDGYEDIQDRVVVNKDGKRTVAGPSKSVFDVLAEPPAAQ